MISVESSVVMRYAGSPDVAVELAEALRDQGLDVAWTAVGEDLMAFVATGEHLCTVDPSQVCGCVPWLESDSHQHAV